MTHQSQAAEARERMTRRKKRRHQEEDNSSNERKESLFFHVTETVTVVKMLLKRNSQCRCHTQTATASYQPKTVHREQDYGPLLSAILQWFCYSLLTTALPWHHCHYHYQCLHDLRLFPLAHLLAEWPCGVSSCLPNMELEFWSKFKQEEEQKNMAVSPRCQLLRCIFLLYYWACADFTALWPDQLQ